MDARFTLAIVFPLALAACSSAPQQPLKNPGLDVFEALINEPAAPDSIVRQGDQLTYLVMPTVAKPWFARFDASCTQPVGRMAYQAKGGAMRPFAEGHSTSLPPAQLEVLLHSEQLRNACAYRAAPDWRALNTDAEQDWQLLDRHSAVLEDGLLKIWTARLLARYQVGANNALVGQLQERLAIDCQQRTFKRLSQFKADANGAVLTAQLNAKELPLAPPDSSQRALIEAACQPAADLASLATPPARTPQMPQLQTPVAAPAVLAAIDALQLPAPRLTLQAVHYSYDTQLFNGMKINGVKREDVFSRDPQSGQLLLQATDAVLGTKLRLSFLGLTDLASRSFDSKTGEQVADTSAITGLSFSGDWQHLPAHSEVAYSLTRANAKEPHTNTITCQVGAALPASQVNPALQGLAKPLTCTRVKAARMEWTETFTWLEDYGVFVMVAENSPVGRWTWRVESVR